MLCISNTYTCYVFLQHCLPFQHDINVITHVQNRVEVRVMSSVTLCGISRKQSRNYKAMELVSYSHIINKTGNDVTLKGVGATISAVENQ